MQRLQLCAGRQPELVGQARGEVAVGLARTRRLAAVGEPIHQRAQRRLVQRIGLEQA